MAFPFKPFSRRQLEVISSPTERYILLADGSVRSGKTIACTVRWINYVRSLPKGTKLLMTGRTRDTLRNNVLDTLFKIVGRANYHYSYQKGELILFGRYIRCVGASDEQAQDIIQGDTFAGWYGDEVALYPKSFIDQGRARCSEDPGLIIWNCNPEGPFHPIYTEFIDDEAEAVREGIVKRYSFTLDDNLALSESYKRQLKAGFTGLFYKRNILGLWVLAEGIVYDQFSLDAHGFDDAQLPASVDAYDLAIDYGTQNPFAGLLIAISGDTHWVLGEYYYSGRESSRQLTDAEYSAELRKFLGERLERKTIIDPSAASMIAQLRKDKFRGITDAQNAVVPGIRTVAGQLASGKLRIHRTACPNLVREFGVYRWDPKAAKKGEDKPVKQHDHALDALRYHQYTLLSKPAFVPMGA